MWNIYMQLKKPRVSIGMPVYNGEKYIRSALDSLLSQTFTDYELIISDNASTDRTWEILQEYQRKDNRIILYRQEENIEAMKNFGFVLQKASGSYFLWAADDDYRANNYISALLELLEEHKWAAMAGSTVVNIEYDDNLTDTGDFDDKINHLKGRAKILSLLESHRTAWVYGFYKIESLRYSFAKYLTDSIIAADRLFLYHYIFNNKVVATSRTKIYKRARPKGPEYGYRPQQILPYLVWSVHFILKALMTLWQANLTIWDKIYITPVFLRRLSQSLYSFTFIELVKSRLKSFRLEMMDSH